MPVLLQPLLGFGQELSAAFNARNPYQGKLASSVRAAHMLKTQEVERIRLCAGLLQVPSDKASEAHYPRLFLRQLQPEFSESIRQILLEVFRIAPVLEVHHEVIRESRQICLPLTRRPDLLFEPKIKNEMQIDIRQDRTYRTALRRPFFRSRHNSSHHEPRVQPFADQIGGA